MDDQIIVYVQEILGAAPAGLEPLEYVVASVLLVMLCMSAVNLISGIFRWIGGI